MKPLLQSETFVRIAAPLAVGVVLLAVWEIGCRLGSIPVYLFPKPSDILAKLATRLGRLRFTARVQELLGNKMVCPG